MQNQPDIPAVAAVRAAGQPFMHQHGVGAAVRDFVDRALEIHQAVNRSNADPVVHGDDNGPACISIEDSFQTYAFS